MSKYPFIAEYERKIDALILESLTPVIMEDVKKNVTSSRPINKKLKRSGVSATNIIMISHVNHFTESSILSLAIGLKRAKNMERILLLDLNMNGAGLSQLVNAIYPVPMESEINKNVLENIWTLCIPGNVLDFATFKDNSELNYTSSNVGSVMKKIEKLSKLYDLIYIDFGIMNSIKQDFMELNKFNNYLLYNCDSNKSLKEFRLKNKKRFSELNFNYDVIVTNDDEGVINLEMVGDMFNTHVNLCLTDIPDFIKVSNEGIKIIKNLNIGGL